MNSARLDLYKLHRPENNRVIFGVCSGLAEYFGLPIKLLRVVALLSLICFFVPTAAVYCLLAFLIPSGPEIKAIDEASRHFHQRLHRNPVNVLDTIEAELSAAALRLEELECYLTSRRFRLDEEFRSLVTEPTPPKTSKPL